MNHKKLNGLAAVTVAGLLTAMTPAMAQNTGTTSGSNTTGSMDSMHHDSMDKGMMGKVSHKDKEFLMKAAMGGMSEVEMGRLAASNATDPDVKAFGQRMVDDHTKANDQLKQVAASKGVTLPTEMDKSERREMDKLAKMTGSEFDHAYVKMMVKDHKEDVSEFSKEADKGTDSDVKSFAGTTLPTLQDHLKSIEDISGKMGGMKHKM
jgi:putative membrane protein